MHISAPLNRVLMRQGLAKQIRAIRSYGPLKAGDLLTWREDGYYPDAGEYVFYPFFIRANLGTIFEEVKHEAETSETYTRSGRVFVAA
jgi:hypothetical protein